MEQVKSRMHITPVFFTRLIPADSSAQLLRQARAAGPGEVAVAAQLACSTTGPCAMSVWWPAPASGCALLSVAPLLSVQLIARAGQSREESAAQAALSTIGLSIHVASDKHIC